MDIDVDLDINHFGEDTRHVVDCQEGIVKSPTLLRKPSPSTFQGPRERVRLKGPGVVLFPPSHSIRHLSYPLNRSTKGCSTSVVLLTPHGKVMIDDGQSWRGLRYDWWRDDIRGAPNLAFAWLQRTAREKIFALDSDVQLHSQLHCFLFPAVSLSRRGVPSRLFFTVFFSWTPLFLSFSLWTSRGSAPCEAKSLQLGNNSKSTT